MLLFSFPICDGDGKCYCLISLSVTGMGNVIVKFLYLLRGWEMLF